MTTSPATPSTPAAATIRKPHVIVYTDGACKGNPGPGGWGAWLATGEHEKELCGGEKLTTNNRMELTAVIEALASLKRSCEVTMSATAFFSLFSCCCTSSSRRR